MEGLRRAGWCLRVRGAGVARVRPTTWTARSKTGSWHARSPL